MRTFNIHTPKDDLLTDIQNKIDYKTKPLGSLGLLEKIAAQICLVQQSLTPTLSHPAIMVFAGDHGLSEEGVSAYPAEVTHQMVLNFLSGGAAINAFCKQHNIDLQIVDAGVNHHFNFDPHLTDRKIAMGTQNSLKTEAMNQIDLEHAINIGSSMVCHKVEEGCNIIGFGEMGIGNTSAASLLMAAFTDTDIIDCVGRGTGVECEALDHKKEVLKQVFEKHQDKIKAPLDYFRSVAGLEMAMMLGAMLQAAESKITIMVDGFIATSVFLTAKKLYPHIQSYALFSHQSDESGHKHMLEYLEAQPILQLGMRLGEGTGCAMAYPIIQSSIQFLNEMASFESAQVSGQS
ncbi:nicotinate-nucleotide--dimethylbenzimidazole phosphoribosyltransferase [Reichenbachiella ulvae]|uniref:Nicotinate-nucleotide--dimethylbenzimidazole phosphoribosyltransferase n=1 Tax=Reichenbachiella ulvae TaxID=2980104 RepID=A0ABT3CQG1_9BACT|nr:nicotinate-nucleotide--dimethylbenzimidazole phosphoribosyltransferase [Reichenbachiella ulvae]MCV9385759.1 nicotinate-nucleotide--dimethylbenzimidazole phosphoribosyltransferase [Reichenbachiella ulvae]